LGEALLYTIIDGFFTCYMLMLVVRIISSWFPQAQGHPILRFICFYTDPYLNFFRRFIPPLGMLDLSPIIAFFALQILEALVKGILFS
jgi:YggT family protein